MDWIRLSLKKAHEEYELMVKNSNYEPKCSGEYEDLKKDIYNIFYESVNELGIKVEEVKTTAYKIDYVFGIKLYVLLKNKYDFNENLAENDEIWRYIQLMVCPKLVHYRNGNNEDRFYKKTRRIWMKTIWWYVFLAWREDEQETKKILEKNTTDTILNIVDRTGLTGYRRELFNEILYQKYNYGITDQELFRNIMTLNTMKVQVIDPYLVDGGITKYVEELFKEVGVSR